LTKRNERHAESGLAIGRKLAPADNYKA